MNVEALVEQIRRGVATGATVDERAAAASACDTVRTLLRATPGQPLIDKPTPSTPLGQAVESLQGAPPGVFLEALIAKLKSMLPEDGAVLTRRTTLRVPFVDVRSVGGKRGDD